MTRPGPRTDGAGPGRPLVALASGARWDGVAGTERRLAEALSRHVEVLWIDPPVSILTPARHRHGRARSWGPRVEDVLPGIRRLTPVGPPGWSRAAVRPVTWPLVRHQVRTTLGPSRPHAVLTCSFDDVLGRWGPDVQHVLYGTDDWVAGAELMGQDAARLRREECAALRRADLVLTVTPELARRWAALGAHPVVLANGCEADAYADVAAGRVAPRPRPPLPFPVAAVVGQLSARIDIGLLEAVVDAGAGLLLVGPRDPAWEPDRSAALLARPEVQHTGARPPDELPSWLAGVDVGLTPYADTAFNRAAFPLKTLEYLAAGRPVVSTDLPAARRLRDEGADIVAAGDRAGFVAAVLAAGRAGGNGPGRDDAAAARHATAREHSWARRAVTLLEQLGIGPDGSMPTIQTTTGVAR